MNTPLPRRSIQIATLCWGLLSLGACSLSSGTTSTSSPSPTPTVSPTPSLVAVNFDNCQNGEGSASISASVSDGLNKDSVAPTLNGVTIVDPSAILSSSNFVNGSTQFSVSYRLTPPALNANGFNLFQFSFRDAKGKSFSGQATRSCTSPTNTPTASPSPSPSPSPSTPPAATGSISLSASGTSLFVGINYTIPAGVAANSYRVTLNGTTDITSRFAAVSTGSTLVIQSVLLAATDGLIAGQNTVTVQFRDGVGRNFSFQESLVR